MVAPVDIAGSIGTPGKCFCATVLGGAVDQRGQRRRGRSRADIAGRGYGQRRVGGGLDQL